MATEVHITDLAFNLYFCLSGKVKELQVLFPGVPDHTVSAALQVSSGDVNEAANTLLLAESIPVFPL